MGECILARTKSFFTSKSTSIPSNSKPLHTKSLSLTFPYTSNFSKHKTSAKRNDVARVARKGCRRLIKISTAEGRWHGNWNTDYIFSLRDLHLQDLAEEDEDLRDQLVSISLSVERHAGLGLSVDGTIVTSFTRICSNCSSPYCRQMNTKFNVWILPLSKESDPNQLPEIGSDDPSVIYVKPGGEADLDSLVQDTIRLTTSVNETCSEFCEKSEVRLQYVGKPKASTIDKRWSKLLELKDLYK